MNAAAHVVERLRQGALAGAMLLLGFPGASAWASFSQTNLVSDLPGVAALQDVTLVNPWGLAASPSGPFWIANNGSGMASILDSGGAALATPIAIPGSAGNAAPSRPTGIVFNSSGQFQVNASPAVFAFATQTGVIAAWVPSAGTTAVRVIDNSASGSSYTGLALVDAGAGSRLYAADFRNGRIHGFDAGFAPVTASFQDPNLPAGYSPFNIQNLGGTLYVTYAQVNNLGEEITGAGKGIVDAFDVSGNLERRVVTGGALDAPWGLALAPAGFGDFGGALLVGNFGDGRINAYDPATGSFLGTITDANGDPIVNPGLWGLQFGNGASGGASGALYITAGIAGPGEIEDHGLFARISPTAPVPEPASAVLLAAGLCALAAWRSRPRG